MIAIDPGPKESGIVVLELAIVPAKQRYIPSTFGKLSNEAILANLRKGVYADQTLAIEQIKCYGNPIGDTTIETIFWSGRFVQAHAARGGKWVLIPRVTVKNHICLNPRAKDKNIRAALIDRYGEPGTKKNKGILYGFTNDIFSALAIGLTACELAAYNQIRFEGETHGEESPTRSGAI